MSVKLISAAVVLFVGFALASLFPKPDQVPGSDAAPADVALRRPTTQTQPMLTETSPGRGSLPPLETALLAEANTPAARVAATRADGSSFRSPPPMPSDFAAAREGSSLPLAAVDSPSHRTATPRMQSEPPREIVHHVVDGDTLTGLAARYLGDASLADRIRQANLDRLPANPNWLPIGLELEIPSANAPVQTSTIVRHDMAETRLVPVVPAPVVAETHPR